MTELHKNAQPRKQAFYFPRAMGKIHPLSLENSRGQEERNLDAQAHFVVDRGAHVGADDVVRERGGVRCARTMLGWLQARKQPGHQGMSTTAREEREPAEVLPASVAEG